MKKLLSLLLVSALPSSAALADITLSYSFPVGLAGGTDTAGMHGATMSFVIQSSQATYSNLFSFPALTPDSIQLTVSGSSVPTNNGVFSIASPGSYRLSPNVVGNLFALTNSGLGNSAFTFGPNNVAVSSFLPGGANITAPSHGSPVNPADFNGATLTLPNWEMDGAFYNAPTFGLAAAVPEPGHYAALFAAGALGLVMWRRRAVKIRA